MCVLYDDIPADERGMDEMAVYHFLKDHGIGYQRMDHEATASIADCVKYEEILGTKICKNLFLCNRQRTRFYLLMMAGEKEFVTKNISAQLGVSRLSFAPAEDMMKYLHIAPGAVSLMGLIHDTGHAVRLLIDEDIVKQEYLGCHPCVNTASLRIRWDEIMTKFLPAIGTEPTYVVIE